MSKKDKINLSVIIPCMNEESNIKKMYEKLIDSLKDYNFELLFIDDGSTDNTLNVLKAIYKEDKGRVKIISFSRNFQKEAAIYAGICKSSGEYCAIIDADLQQNPNYLKEMYNFLEENPDYDQVAMVMSKRKTEGLFLKICKKAFYKIIDAISEIHFVSGASDFRMFRQCVKETIKSMNEVNRFSKGIFSWIGFKTKYIPYNVEKRTSGKSKFNLKRNFSYAFDGIIGYSTKPLRIATILGIITSMSSFIYFISILIKTLIVGKDIPGYSSMMCIILLLGGIQLITIGILGEYLAKAYLETKKRPIYISKEEIGFEQNIL